MTKTTLIPILLFFSISIFGQKNMKIDYEMVKTLPTESLTNLPDNIKTKLMEELKKPEHYTLFIGKANSFYTNENKDKVTLNESKTKTDNTTKTVSTKFKNTPIKYYRANNSDSILIHHQFEDEEFYASKIQQWKKVTYKPETSVIDNFTCKLVEVVLADNSIAKVWYTEKIPFSGGPLVFYDFPGLVLKVDTPNYTISATNISDGIEESEIKTINPKIKVYRGELLTEKMNEMQLKRATPKESRKVIKL